MQVHPETLKSTGLHTYGSYTREEFTVEVTIGKDRRTIRCHPEQNRSLINLYGLALKFSSGSKVWEGQAIYWCEKGYVSGLTPRIDRRGHFFLVGFYEDFATKAIASQHNGA